jgi:cytochrome c oxidase accessory protein FixG
MRFTPSTYRGKRRLVEAGSTLLVILLPFLNILRLDIPTLRFYFLASVLWVDEFYLLFLVIMLVLWIVVIFAMLYGRVWCGWMCPQTVLDDLYYWFERRSRRWLKVPSSGKLQGTARIRWLAQRVLLSLASIALGLFVGFNLVAYFIDPYRMLGEISSLTLGPVTLGCIIGIAILIWVDLTFWRQKFCAKACPYGMMQAVFTDSKTQIVRYATERNDECIECKACVRDCMMGIDIRQSPYQTECIHCGDCVDSCTAILSRMKQPRPTLISFSWGEKDVPRTTWYQRLGFVDAKRWAVLGLTVVYGLVLIILVHARTPLFLTASGDRSTLYHIAEDGRVYNDYSFTISNRSLNDDEFVVTCCAGRGTAPGTCAVAISGNPVKLHSREVLRENMRLYIGRDALKPGPNRITLIARSMHNPDVQATTEIVFFMPEKGIADAGAFRKTLP